MTRLTPTPEPAVVRLRMSVCGAVQGVGFRPFIYRLAKDLGLTGWVNNSTQGVLIEVEGGRRQLEEFRRQLETSGPPRSFIQSCEATWLDAAGHDRFDIRESENLGGKTAFVMPDIATCPDCLREILDPANRRHRYPFTNCTNCGPRFSIIEALPYDRANTSMRSFLMCDACQAEYNDPCDRRFHAQPNACPACGPQLELWQGAGKPRAAGTLPNAAAPRRLARGDDALLAAAHAIRDGQIVAVKGVGGFHLLADARNEDAVRRLRERKHREEKPFALMFPALESVRRTCEVSGLEERLLSSPEAPIVLLRKSAAGTAPVAEAVAPGNPCLGVMLPSNPLHHLLMAGLDFPVVATSGNLSDEPVCTDELEALERLRGIPDVFLVHNRPIVRHVDDSIVRVMLGREMVLRRARGYAPLPIHLQPPPPGGQVILAVGAHLKNAVALAVGELAFTSQHIGDLETEQAHAAFRRVAADLPRLYDVHPDVVAADLHPDYLSTKMAEETAGKAVGSAPAAEGAPRAARPILARVQHHIAHALSCLAENEAGLPALGVAWDGTGYGADGTIWGCEFFRISEDAVERVASLRPFPLPGGDAAAKEPRRAALGLLHELARGGDRSLPPPRQVLANAFSATEMAALEAAMARGVNSPPCSSMGRLFDAVAALAGLRFHMGFEGQAAMELEFALEGIETEEAYEMRIVGNPTGSATRMLDWAPMITAILADVTGGVSAGEISARFHNALALAIVQVAREAGCPRVALSGGCFQNRHLTERSVRLLRAAGFQPYWHQRVPPNDGGIALGQIIAARRELAAGRAASMLVSQTMNAPSTAQAAAKPGAPTIVQGISHPPTFQ